MYLHDPAYMCFFFPVRVCECAQNGDKSDSLVSSYNTAGTICFMCVCVTSCIKIDKKKKNLIQIVKSFYIFIDHTGLWPSN